MNTYAIATIGPVENPNKKIYVEVVGQYNEGASGRFLCNDLSSGKALEIREHNLKIVWLEPNVANELIRMQSSK
jgi:hypothetical protein